MTTKPTVQALKTWARENRSLAETVIKARVFAEMERERVDAYVRPIFERYRFTDDLGAGPRKGTGERRDGQSADAPRRVLTNPRDIYLSEDETRVEAYFAEVQRAHAEHGWEGDPEHCPALVAESLQCKAEGLLLDAMATFSGAEPGDFSRTLDLRAKALEWALTVCLGKLS